MRERPLTKRGKDGAARPEGLDADALCGLYERMSLLRKFETAAQIACRKGETPGFLHLYIGEEAVAVGVCAHLRPTDWITSTHRGHGHALAKGMNPNSLLAELYGKRDGCCGGRGGTMHLYDRSIGLFGTNGIVAAGISHAVGAGISARARGTDDIGVAFFGDGAVNHGGFHEAVNFAGIQRAPVVLVCENNLYATATPLSQTTLNVDIASKAAAYGVPGVAVDGNDVLAVWQATKAAVERARTGGGPTLIEARTYRTVGHHEGDPVVGSYRTREEIDAWASRDPIRTFRSKIVDQWKTVSDEALDAIDERVDGGVARAVEFARASPEPDAATVGLHVFAEPLNPSVALLKATPKGSAPTGWLDAVRDGIAEEMRRDPHILYFGEGTGERGGTFAHTKGLWAEFGPSRMVDTPISEQGFTGAAIGASATGARVIADLMFADFAFEAGGQIALQAPKLRYMSNNQMNAPVVIRMGAGALRSAGPHHSGSYHPAWAHIPGLIVCLPSNAADAKGLMKTALRASDPVMMFEPKALFATKADVPAGGHFVPFGVARIARPGRDITIAAAGQLVGRALEAATALAGAGVEAEVIDLRTIMPLDVETVAASVARTHHLLVVDEGWAAFGVGAEIGQAMNELAHAELLAPVGRLHTDAQPHPFAPALERAMLVNVEKIVAAARSVLGGVAPTPRHWRALGSRFDSRPPAITQVASILKVADAERREAVSAPLGEPISMPFGDLTVSEGTIVNWLKAEGDKVARGEIVAEIETDKAIVEIEAPKDGILGPIERRKGDVVPMGGRIGSIRS